MGESKNIGRKLTFKASGSLKSPPPHKDSKRSQRSSGTKHARPIGNTTDLHHVK